MARCRRCGADNDVGDLTRHERDGFVIVHCPDCGQLLGRYDGRRR